MSSATPPSEDMLNFVAELRAEGLSWDRVAARIKRNPRTLRKWRNKYADRWKLASAQAERGMAAEAECESVIVLRRLLRSIDEKVRWHAAKSLIALRLDLGKLDSKAPQAEAPRQSPELTRLFTFLDGHPDAELQAIVADLAPLPDPDAACSGPRDGGCAA